MLTRRGLTHDRARVESGKIKRILYGRAVLYVRDDSFMSDSSFGKSRDVYSQLFGVTFICMFFSLRAVFCVF
jgi:hypothetical protein